MIFEKYAARMATLSFVILCLPCLAEDSTPKGRMSGLQFRSYQYEEHFLPSGNEMRNIPRAAQSELACSPTWKNLDNAEETFEPQNQAIISALIAAVDQLKSSIAANQLSVEELRRRCDGLKNIISDFAKIVNDIDHALGLKKVNPQIFDRMEAHSRLEDSMRQAQYELRIGDSARGGQSCLNVLGRGISQLTQDFTYSLHRLKEFDYKGRESWALDRFQSTWKDGLKKLKENSQNHLHVLNSDAWKKQSKANFHEQSGNGFYPSKKEELVAFKQIELWLKLLKHSDARAERKDIFYTGDTSPNITIKERMELLQYREDMWKNSKEASKALMDINLPLNSNEEVRELVRIMVEALKTGNYPEASEAEVVYNSNIYTETFYSKFNRAFRTEYRVRDFLSLKRYFVQLRDKFSDKNVALEIEKIRGLKESALSGLHRHMQFENAFLTPEEREEFSKLEAEHAKEMTSAISDRSKSYWRMIAERRNLVLKYNPWQVVKAGTPECIEMQLFFSTTPLGVFRSELKPSQLLPVTR